MIDMRELLQSHIEEAYSRDMVWGVDDCTSWVAAWVERLAGRAVKRPNWSSEAEALQLVAGAGSLDALWDEVMAENGYREAISPERGDVGIIAIREKQVGGIFLSGGYFAWRGEPRGVAILRPRDIVRAWAIIR